ncbi:hypothetical protein [Actinoplanes regularis]|uniref:Uncharacterized protein n=1 Tax=Actinoplanes regularis TaxID=52697 RepID=A0A238Y1S4_9ACTN|nr:hypothetical protein [Actinoplanes regularis]GIE86286.1 hypothetical protein Are01nite_27660 [Actinoplanes regularis]SNR64768.1 hypothetical protein SAMN06264365_104167 [Actinoplanes regularis]
MGFHVWARRGREVSAWAAMIIWICIGVLVTVAVIAIFAFHCKGTVQPCGTWDTFATGLIVAAAAMLVGGLVGFIFGVPKVFSSDGSGHRPLPPREVVANTNLEQVSDWLTKILVGIGLTQFQAIGDAAHDLFEALAPSFGGRPTGTIFAGGLTVFAAAFGFVTGWLYSRLLLGEAMARADQRGYVAAMYEQEAVQAEKDGDSQGAVQLRNRARDVLHGMTDIGAAYEDARRSMPVGLGRTGAFDRLAEQARRIARFGHYDAAGVKAALTDGSDGERIAALAIMEVQTDIADLETVRSVLAAPRSANEQYLALRVIRNLIPHLRGQDRERIRAYIDGIRPSMSHGVQPRLLADDIIRLLDQSGS